VTALASCAQRGPLFEVVLISAVVYP